MMRCSNPPQLSSPRPLCLGQKTGTECMYRGISQLIRSSLFPYPLQGRADINITEGDKWRVAAGDFLNDTLIEFGLK